MPTQQEPTDTDDSKKQQKQETVGGPFKKKLSESGGGAGLALHIDAALAREYDLNSETEVEVSVVEEAGDVAFRIDIPAGFTNEELEAFASEKSWELVDRYVGDTGQWSISYRTEGKDARISIDSESRIDGKHVNNVFIESCAVEISEYQDYLEVSTAAYRKDLGVRLRDSKGLWQSLRGSTEHETDDAPDEEVAKQLINKADWVSAQFIDRETSTKTTLQEIGQVVQKISEAISDLEESVEGQICRLDFDVSNDDPSGTQIDLGEATAEATTHSDT